VLRVQRQQQGPQQMDLHLKDDDGAYSLVRLAESVAPLFVRHLCACTIRLLALVSDDASLVDPVTQCGESFSVGWYLCLRPQIVWPGLF